MVNDPTQAQQAIPSTPAPAWSPQVTIKRMSTSRLLVLATIVTLLCSLCSCVSGLAIGASTHATHTSPATPTQHTTVATPKAMATVNTVSYASPATYEQVSANDAGMMVQALSRAGDGCGANDIPTCTTDMETVQTDIQNYLSDLDAYPAPPCLQATDRDMRASLHFYADGTQLALTALRSGSYDGMTQAADAYSQGYDLLQNATDALKASSC